MRPIAVIKYNQFPFVFPCFMNGFLLVECHFRYWSFSVMLTIRHVWNITHSAFPESFTFHIKLNFISINSYHSIYLSFGFSFNPNNCLKLFCNEAKQSKRLKFPLKEYGILFIFYLFVLMWYFYKLSPFSPFLDPRWLLMKNC